MDAVLTLTLNPTIDMHATIDKVIPEKKLNCGIPVYEPGGGGINVSRALKNLGGSSHALFTAGGTMGDFLTYILKKQGISCYPFKIDNNTRENVIITEEASKLQFRFGMPGPELSEREWQALLACLENWQPAPDFIIASGSLPPGMPADFYARIADIIKGKHSKLIVDTRGEPLRLAVEAGVYLLKPNIREFKSLTGTSGIKEWEENPEEYLSGEAAIFAQAGELIDKKKCEVIFISLGAGGALLITAQEKLHFKAPIVPVKSKIGAGDSMTAGFVLSLLQGRSIKEAALYGIAAGSSAVMTPGTELCRKSETDVLYEQLKKLPA